MAAAACLAITVEADQDLSGAYPQQSELAEFETAAGRSLSFKENAEIAVP
ncbi:MAG: hypothetical protein AAGC57_07045 [Pseudomonadota bacterium]